MATKRKGKQPQAVSSPKLQTEQPKVPPKLQPTDRQAERKDIPREVIEGQINRNGRLVAEFIRTEVWTEIISPLIDETIASVAGRKTNGRWHHGSLTKHDENLEFLKGYQKCGMDIHNRLMDFIDAKSKLEQRKQEELQEMKAPIINPFMDDFNDGKWPQE